LGGRQYIGAHADHALVGRQHIGAHANYALVVRAMNPQ
jgi:hypothetical protein